MPESAAAQLERGSISWPDWREDPTPLYQSLRDGRPVFYDEPNDMYLVTRYADVDMVLKAPGRFSSTPVQLLDGRRISPLREEDPPRHTLLRRIVMPLFAPGAMRRLRPYFRTVARELLDQAEHDDIVEVSTQLATPLPGRVTCDLLGVPREAHERFLALTAERLELLGVSEGRISDDGSHRPLAEIRDAFWEIVGPVFSARRTEPAHDAITLIVQAQEQHGRDELGDQLAVDILLNLLSGGFHTTQHLVESLLDLLADRPDLWERMRADRMLVPDAIEEMLRYDAPGQALRRRPRADIVMHGERLPLNSSVAVVYGSANHDERVFSQPETFSLERDTKRHLAFGAGIHYCPGAPVSRFEVHALLDEMLDRYVAVDRAGPSARWPVQSDTVEAMHGYRRVPVRLVEG